MRQYTRLLRIALLILGSFLLAFMVLGLVFTFRIKKSTVTAEAKSLVENLGTKSEIDAASELAALQQTEVQTQAAGLEQAETQDLVQNESQVQDQNQEQAQTENGQESGTSLDAMIAQWNEELDADTVTNLTDEEQVAVRTLFANTIFFGDSMTQAIGEYGFLDMTNIVYQRSATIDVLITKIPEVAAMLPKQVVIFTGLNDCNHYTEIADYRRDYVTMLQQLKASIPGVKIIVSSLLSPSDALGQVRADLVRAPQFDQELRSICQENDVAYLAAFEGSLWDASASAYILDDSQVADFAADMLCSIANAKPLSGLTQNATRANIRKLAEKRGTGWEQGVVQTASASQMLMLIEYATFNMQSVIGNGAVSKTDDGKTSMTENTGATITLGNASGSVVNANGIQIVSYRGEENFWGNIWWWIDGINHYANATTGECETYVADHGFADDIKAAPYEDTGMTAKYGNGYISAFCYSEDFDWLFLPGEFNGNTALPVGDHCWNQNGTGWRVAVLGAYWYDGLSAGAFCWRLYNASSHRYRSVGGRLVYRKKVAA